MPKNQHIISELEQRAHALLDENRLSEAKDLYQQLCELTPRDVESWLKLGELNSELGQLEVSASCLHKALMLEPDHPEANFMLSRIYQQQGRVDEALDYCQRSVSSDPGLTEAWELLGRILVVSGNYPAAESAYQQFARLQPESVKAHICLAKALHAQNKFSQAIISYQRALQLNTGWWEGWALVGQLQAKLGQWAGAASCYQKALDIQPEQATTINLLAGAQLQLGKLDEAFINCERALRLEPKSPEIHANFGNVLIAQTNLEAAEHQFRTALQLKPGFVGAKINLANILIQLGNAQEAIEYFQQILRANPGIAEIHLDLGTAYQSLGRFDDAMHSYKEALRINPSMPTILVNIGYLHKLNGKLDKALKYFNQAVQIAPNYPLANYNLAMTYKALGEFDLALKHCRQAVDYAPDFADARLSLALLALLTGNLAEGWKHYGARRSVRDTLELTLPLAALATDLQDTQLLVTKDQGIGDEIFFLRFVPLLKERGANITYRADEKIAQLVSRLPYIDRVVTSDDATDSAHARISVGDLPGLLDINDISLIPPPTRLEPLPETVNRIQQQLRKFGNPPFIGVTWWAGTKMPPLETLTTEKLAHREIPVDLLASMLSEIGGTVLVLQRGPEADELDRLGECLGVKVFDLSALNDNLEEMLALLLLLDEYVGVDNTNMHLRLAAGKGSRILVPHPPEWRSSAYGSSSPWFPGCTIYRQSITGDWSDAVNACAADITAGLAARVDLTGN
jgi:tetratricopeptide (TPR) repeat protein